MESFKNIGFGIFHGIWDSVNLGVFLVFHIDDEIYNQEKEKEQRALMKRQRNQETSSSSIRRSPSPAPSSASQMAREEMEREQAEAERIRELNSDERTLNSIKKKSKPPEEQMPKAERKVAKQVIKCCLLNGGFTWLSIILFEHVLLPILGFFMTLFYGAQNEEAHIVWSWLQSILSIIFGMMWVMPIFLLSKIVSSLWFADIANAAYKARKGKPQMIPGISKLVADFLFSLLVQALFLVQSILVSMFPVRYIGQFLCIVHLSLLYSLYAFEYKWFNMGWELHRRLSYIEINWPYFLGFGLPLTILTSLTDSVIVSGCIFSMFFPFFILSGNEAKPIVGITETPLRLFTPVIFVSNIFFTGLRGSQPSRKPKPIGGGRGSNAQRQQLPADDFLEQRVQLQQQMHELNLRQRRSNSREFSSRGGSPSPSGTPTYRYQQPPPFNPPPRQSRSTPDRYRSSQSSGFESTLMRPLIPTVAGGAQNMQPQRR